MEVFEVDSFLSFTLAIILLFVGKGLTQRSEILRRYSIPEPVIGGFLCAAGVAIAYFLFDMKISFGLEARDFLLVYFFAAIGLHADLRTLISGGKPLAILLVLASTFILLQNLMGMGVAGAFGMDPKAGLMVGSISLTGGVGTALAWAPTFVESLGINNALELGIASNTVGLIAACVVGGPIARFLITRHKLETGGDSVLDVGVPRDEGPARMVDSYAILWAWLWLNVTLVLGFFINEGLEAIDITLPFFVSCLMGGILIGNARNFILKRDEAYPGAKLAIALISDVSLGMFLTMALMGLQLWELQGILLFIAVAMLFQVLLSVLFTVFIVFRAMGSDYEASVMCAGFGGITLGSTATAIVNMTAVAKQYGAAHRAFIVVPLVCGFFIDLVNALIINFLVGV